ncbi:MAG: leucine-rich repeat domain-containing protein, partial [Oscillospiraceae bacterium]|nr:leucine-rich repeat domain-containing protein [Oscillospiraceae bacterium]
VIDECEVTKIGDYAFASSGITGVTIPDSVTVIGSYAFTETKIKSVKIPASLDAKNCGSGIFQKCTDLTTVDISKGVTAIPSGMFLGCTALTSITIPDSVVEIGDQAFSGSGLTSITIPDSVTVIGDSAFAMSKITSASIPGSLDANKCKSYIFYNCTSLKSVKFSEGATTILPYMFNNCTALTSVTIPDSVKTIDDSAFKGCAEDLTIHAPEGSAAAVFAKNHGFTFEPLGDTPAAQPDTTTAVTTAAPTEETTTEAVTTAEAETTTAPTEQLVAEDKDTGVQIYAAEGVLPSDVKLNVAVDPGAQTDTSIAFDITLTDADGKAVKLNGNVTVKIPVPDKLNGAENYYVFHQAEDGELTDMHAAVEGDYVSFVTDHFSTFILSTEKLPNDDSPATGVTLLFIPAVIAAAAAAVTKKRK